MEDLEQQARSLLVKPDLSVMAERIKEMEVCVCVCVMCTLCVLFVMCVTYTG